MLGVFRFRLENDEEIKKKKKHPIIVYFEVPFVMLFVNEMGDDEVDV